MSCGATIASASSRQTCTSLSTVESELFALMLCVRVVLAVRRIFEFVLRCTLPPTIIYEDNTTVIAQLRDHDLSGRTHHQHVHKGFIIDAIDAGEIVIVWRETGKMVADMTTKMDTATFAAFDNYASGYSSEL